MARQRRRAPRGSSFDGRPVVGRIALFGMLGAWLLWYALTASNLLPGSGPFQGWILIILASAAVAVVSLVRRERPAYAIWTLSIVLCVPVLSVLFLWIAFA